MLECIRVTSWTKTKGLSSRNPVKGRKEREEEEKVTGTGLCCHLLHTGVMFGVETPSRDKVGRHVWLSSWHCLQHVVAETKNESNSAKLNV